ncbi:MAG: hypothetical protein AAF848_14910, partial [Pseudomonadota bacterium]
MILRPRNDFLTVGWLIAMVATLGMTLFGPQRANAQYLLQPGDTVKIAIAGLPVSEIEAAVDIDGFLSLAWFGTHVAANRPASDVLAEIKLRSAGKVIKRYNNDGDLRLVNINPEDIFLQVTGYQPFIIGGDVTQPGQYDYRPGLTVRGAIALARGEAELALDADIQDPIQMLRWQADFQAAALDHAVANILFWRYTAQINEDYDLQPPSAVGYRVAPDVFNELLAEQQSLIQIARVNDQGQRAFLAKALQQAETRMEILAQQKEQNSELIAADEAEEQRARELLAGGLTNATRLADARRAVVLTATRVLETEENLARAELDVTRMSREVDAFEETRKTELLAERDGVRTRIYLAKLRMDNLSRLLA